MTIATTKVLLVDDSPVTQWVADQLAARGYEAVVQGSFDVTQDLDGFDLMVIDPAMPSKRQDLPVQAVHDDALELYERAQSKALRRLVFSSFSRSCLGAIMDGTDVALASQDIFSKRDPEALVRYISGLAAESPRQSSK